MSLKATEFPEHEDPAFEVEGEVEVTQEVKADNAVNPIFLGEGVTEDLEIFNAGSGQAEGFESHLGNEMASGSVAEGGQSAHCFRGKPYGKQSAFGDGSHGGTSIQSQPRGPRVPELNSAGEDKQRCLRVKGELYHSTTAMPFFGLSPT